MSETVITVQGTFAKLYPAERADAAISVHLEGPSRADVFDAVTESAQVVTTSIEALDDDAVARWSSDRLRTWDEKPWSQDGTQLPLVFHARIGFTVRFSDFDRLSTWLELVVDVPGVEVESLLWDLTESTRTTATAEVRSRAVKDAVAKASIYAQSIGLGSVSATAIADPGMLGVSGSTEPSFRMAKDLALSSTPDAQLSLKPESIEIEATVDARFVAK